MWANVDVAHAQGAQWRHEQLTLQMLLATYEHHAAPRRQMKATSREEESEMNNAMGQKTFPRQQARCTSVWTTTETCLPPGRHLSLRCGHSQGFSGTPRCRSLTSCRVDVLVPQVGSQMVEVLQKIDTPSLVEQVIAVPKISLNQIPQRSAVRRTQKAEPLVEVPTDSAYAFGAIISSAFKVFSQNRILSGCSVLSSRP